MMFVTDEDIDRILEALGADRTAKPMLKRWRLRRHVGVRL